MTPVARTSLVSALVAMGAFAYFLAMVTACVVVICALLGAP